MKLDQIESAFRSAAKARFHIADVKLRKIMVVTDLEKAEASAFTERVQGFLTHLGSALEWDVTTPEALGTVETLLGEVESAAPDLIVTYRNLGTQAWRYPWSLGVHLDVLTQAISTPVLVLPNPRDEHDHALTAVEKVMVVTDHLTGDDHLVNQALAFVGTAGTLVLTHVEDAAWFEHYLSVISKIPEIDSGLAKDLIGRQVMKEPRDYIQTVQDVLQKARSDMNVASEVCLDQELPTYRRLVEEHQVDLVVMNTKDEAQLAMHGLAHALAVELRSVPMLLL